MRTITKCFNNSIVSYDEMDISLLQIVENLMLVLLSEFAADSCTNFKKISDNASLFFRGNQAYIFFRQDNDEFYLRVSVYAIQLSQNKNNVSTDPDVMKSIVYSVLNDIINEPSNKVSWFGDIQNTLRDWGHYAESSTILLKIWC